MTSRNHREQAAGFSLVELMVVTAISAVLVTVATVGMVSMRRQSVVNGETRVLLGRLQDARMKAVAMGEKHGVYIGGPGDPQYPSQMVVFAKTNPNATSVLLDMADGGTDRVLVAQNIGDSSSGSSRVLVGNVPDAGSVTVTFDSTGMPTVSTTSGGTSTPYDWSGGPYYFQLQSLDDPSPPRTVMLRSDGTMRVQ